MMMDTGLNQYDKSKNNSAGAAAQDVRFRCPHCHKLYCTSSDVFEGAAPAEFDCAACDKPFVLSQHMDQFGLYMAKAPPKAQFDSCPKCSHLKPLESDECPSCGIVVSKYLELQKLESPALYELNRQWQQVVLHFDEDQCHQDFINKCHKNMALNFAYQKYTDLQKTMGGDVLCVKYMNQIQLRIEEQIKSPRHSSTVKPATAYQFNISPVQFIFTSMGLFGMLLLIYNKYVPTFPNFNGLVLSLTIISFGIGIFSNSTKSPLKEG